MFGSSTLAASPRCELAQIGHFFFCQMARLAFGEAAQIKPAQTGARQFFDSVPCHFKHAPHLSLAALVYDHLYSAGVGIAGITDESRERGSRLAVLKHNSFA